MFCSFVTSISVLVRLVVFHTSGNVFVILVSAHQNQTLMLPSLLQDLLCSLSIPHRPFDSLSSYPSCFHALLSELSWLVRVTCPIQRIILPTIVISSQIFLLPKLYYRQVSYNTFVVPAAQIMRTVGHRMRSWYNYSSHKDRHISQTI